jgi:hypothetical protein
MHPIDRALLIVSALIFILAIAGAVNAFLQQ